MRIIFKYEHIFFTNQNLLNTEVKLVEGSKTAGLRLVTEMKESISKNKNNFQFIYIHFYSMICSVMNKKTYCTIYITFFLVFFKFFCIHFHRLFKNPITIAYFVLFLDFLFFLFLNFLQQCRMKFTRQNNTDQIVILEGILLHRTLHTTENNDNKLCVT